MFFAYVGFDAVSTAAQEAKNPQRDMPRAMFLSLGIATVLYMAVGLVLTGLVHYSQLNVPAPLALGVAATGVRWLPVVVEVGALAALTSVMIVMVMAQPRIFYSMSRDGLLPPLFSRVHPRYHTPWITTIITGVAVALAAGLLPIGVLGQLVSMGTLLAFVIVCAGVLVLRRTQPDIPRPFRTPGAPWVPIAGALVCLYLMTGLPLATWERLIVWLAIGFAIYFLYGRRTAARLRSEASVTPP